MTDETSDPPLGDGLEGLDGLDDVDPTLPGSDPIAQAEQTAEQTADHDADPTGPDADDDGPLLTEGLDPEDLDAAEEVQRAMEDARARLAEVPAEVVVTNHVMGLYELAAIHLSSDPPDLASAALAIDAVACLVDGLGDRLGQDAATMRDALNNIRIAFVQIKGGAATDGG